jgi:hypothetical protein
MGKWLTAYREGQWRQASDTTLYERTKKGGRVAWSSPTYGLCSGRLLMDPGEGWVLVQGNMRGAVGMGAGGPML